MLALSAGGAIKSQSFEIVGRDETFTGRDVLWANAFKEAIKTPLLGKGFGSFWTEDKGLKLVRGWNPNQGHNSFLDLWLDIGILGIILFFICFPITLLMRWNTVRGEVGSLQRRYMAALYSMIFAYFIFYSFAQSFFLLFAKFAFLIFVWAYLLVMNRDQNGVKYEFAD